MTTKSKKLTSEVKKGRTSSKRVKNVKNQEKTKSSRVSTTTISLEAWEYMNE